MLTHTHHRKNQKPSQNWECSVHHLTFGGRCLNCGYNPEMICSVCNTVVKCLYAEQAGKNPERYACAKCIVPLWKDGPC